MNLERWGWYSIGVNVLLTLINLAIAAASSSLAVAAEMVHNLVDLLASVAVLVGLKVSGRKSKSFPYGLYKVENMVSVALSIMIFFTAYEIAQHAFFSPDQETTVNAWMLVGVALSAVIPLAFSHFELQAGQEANSPALIADAQEYRAHVFTSGTVLAALLGQHFGVPLDRIAALIIVVVIARSGWELFVDGMRVLLDASLDPDTLLQIREIIQAEPTVAELKWVTGHNAGRFRFVEAEVTLRVQDLDKAAAVTHRIQDEIRQAVPHMDRVLIHAEPVERTHLRLAVPLADASGTLSEHFGEASFFALVTLRTADGVVERQETLTNPHQQVERAKGIHVAEWLVEHKVDVVLAPESLRGKGPTYVFGEAGVDTVYEIEESNLTQAIQAYWQAEKSEKTEN